MYIVSFVSVLFVCCFFFFFKQKTAYEMRISDWSSDVCCSDLELIAGGETGAVEFKSTLRINLHTGQPDEKMHLSALKTIAGFLNAKGGKIGRASGRARVCQYV